MRIVRRLSVPFGPIVAVGLVLLGSLASADDGGSPLKLTVDAGRFDRRDIPLQITIPIDAIPDELGDRLARLAATAGRLVLREEGGDGLPITAQVDHPGEESDRVRILWVLPGESKAGSRRVFGLDPDSVGDEPAPGPWAFRTTDEGHLELVHQGRTVFRYNTRPVDHPDHPSPNQPRDAYIHPAFTPSGAMITGDYSARSHPHHRGFFLAYTKTEVGDLHPDFWNIQAGSGKVRFDHLGDAKTGPVSARFSSSHRWEAARPDGEPTPVLRERWDVEAFDIPGTPFWLIDLTSTQQATDVPMVLPPYRYGGMAYRGPDTFFPRGVLDVLTSEGLDRVRGDQKPARWVDLTGPIADGSDSYAGAAVLDHPGNVNHPTPARIHPTTLPFFCFTPSHDTTVTIGTEAPTVFRYRILIHDDHPDADRNEQAWRDFAEPPEVLVAFPSR